MHLKARITKLESKVPTEKIVDFLGMKIKASELRKAIESAEGTALRPSNKSSRYLQ